MKYFKIVVFLFSFIFVTRAAMAEQPQDRVLTMEDSGKDIKLAPGETIKLQLKSPGTTGYMWYVDELDETHLKLMHKDIVHPFSPQYIDKNKMRPMGGFGIDIWTFKALAPGDVVLKLLEYRGWLGNESVIDQFEAKIHIIGSGKIFDEPADEIERSFTGVKRSKYFDFFDNGGEAWILSNSIIIVELKVQDETGADWYIDGLDQSHLKFIGKKMITVSPKVLAGGAVVEDFFYKATDPGDTTLRLLYYKPSEGKENAANIFEIKLHITDKQ